jgi:hypothetical protein
MDRSVVVPPAMRGIRLGNNIFQEKSFFSAPAPYPLEFYYFFMSEAEIRTSAT